MLTTDIKRKIDSARDILVGKVPDPKAQVDQITNALIYKFMDDMDQESVDMGGKPQFFNNGYEKYAWSKLMDPKLGGLERLDLYVEAIANLSKNPHLPQLFRDIFKDAFLPYRDPETLSLFLKQINEFTYHHSEELGNSFEYLLSILGSQGDAGQFRTPRHIIDFIVSVVDPKKTDRILDPACGTAGFLISAYKHILASHDAKDNATGEATTAETRLTPDERKRLVKSVVGYDISPDMVKLSRVNMYLHGFPEPHIFEYDTLTSEDKWDDSFDVILANPPFMSPKGGIRPHKRFSVQANRSEVLFVDYIAEHLTSSGRAGIIVPEGIIFQSGTAYKQLRKMLVENYLYAVISLPSGVFQPYSGVKTSILLIDHELAKKSKNILFVKIANDGRTLGSQRRVQDGNQLDPARVTIEEFRRNPDASGDQLRQAAASKPLFTIGKSLIGGIDAIGNPDEIHNLQFEVVNKEKIANTGDYNLTGDRYSEVAYESKQDWPTVELQEVAKVLRGTSITSRDIKEGEVPVVAGGQSPAYNHNVANREGKTITVSGSGAYAGFVNYFEKPIFVSDASSVQSKDESIALTRFLYWLLKGNQEGVYKLQTGMGQPHVYAKDLAKFKIPLPPIGAQKEIVVELDNYQSIINAARTIADNYNPALPSNPDWPRVKLGDVCRYAGGTQPPKSTFITAPRDGYIRLLQIRDYKSDKDAVYIPASERHKTCDENDIMIGRYGPPVFQILKGKAGAYNVALMKCLPDESKLAKGWLYYFLKSDPVQRRIITLSTRVRQAGVRPDDLDQLEIPLPSLSEQKEILKHLESEQNIVNENKKLARSLEQKISARVKEVWV